MRLCLPTRASVQCVEMHVRVCSDACAGKRLRATLFSIAEVC